MSSKQPSNMTASNSSQAQNQISAPNKSQARHSTSASNNNLNYQQQQLPLNVINCSSLAFQQIKQTQASLARLSRHVHFNNNNNNNQQNLTPNKQTITTSDAVQSQQKSPAIANHTFVDCLIRRFKNCFSQDFCQVPVFVVGNLSPGSDGTHLILPPCVSLGGQNISRFAGAKNLRLLNSIRESCRSIEQLDLGSNRLNDLIEIYKILQCTPNLKFLNLSENDLSRTAPVAMAPATTTQSATPPNIWSPVSPISFNANYYTLHNNQHQRGYLATLNQNSASPNGNQASSFACSRRHSSLGQNSGARANLARVPEARRLAAVAQTRKTQASSVAAATSSKSANHNNERTNITASQSISSREAPGSHHRLSTKSACNQQRSLRPAGSSAVKSGQIGNQKSRTTTTAGSIAGPLRTKSSMHLVRSLSSLSAKDVRVAVGSRKVSDLRDSNALKSRPSSFSESPKLTASNRQTSSSVSLASEPIANSKQQASLGPTGNKPSVTCNKPLFCPLTEPICETDNDVDMSDCPTTTSTNANSAPSSANINGSRTPQIMTTTATTTNNATTGTSEINVVNQNSLKQQQTGKQQTISITQQQQAVANNNNMQSIMQQHSFKRTFESIKALALNNTGCQWRVVCSILSRMPNLEELHLSLNNYERIDLDANSEFKHTSLKRLYLCNNPKLTDWKELNKLLIAFPSLEALSIADCNISQIPENLAQSREWRKICGLNINGWPIKEWPVIERLNELPSLIDLKCRNLALLNTIDEPRDHLIARLPNLQRLNGSEIEERDHAEKAFLRFFVTNSHLERPRRFHELIQIHGSVDAQVDVDVDLSPPSQANVRVVYLNKNYFRQNDQDDILMSEDFLNKLMATPDDYNTTTNNSTQDFYHNQSTTSQQLDSIDSQSGKANTSATDQDNNTDDGTKLTRLFKDESQEVVALDIDLRQSVRKFKHIIANIFGFSNSQNIILYYIDHEMVGLMGPELIKHNQKKLWNYNVQDGDQFIVEEL